MRSIKEVYPDDTWAEDRGYTENEKKVVDALEGLSTIEKANAILGVLGHDEEMINIVSSRINFETLHYLLSCGKFTVEEALLQFGAKSYQYGKEVMEKYYPDEHWKGVE